MGGETRREKKEREWFRFVNWCASDLIFAFFFLAQKVATHKKADTYLSGKLLFYSCFVTFVDFQKFERAPFYQIIERPHPHPHPHPPLQTPVSNRWQLGHSLFSRFTSAAVDVSSITNAAYVKPHASVTK